MFAIGFSTNSNALFVMGNRSCEMWVKNSVGIDVIYATNISWLSGYLSGVAVGSKVDFLKTVDVNSLDLWMNNYCTKNPLKTVGEGADILVIELKKKK